MFNLVYKSFTYPIITSCGVKFASTFWASNPTVKGKEGEKNPKITIHVGENQVVGPQLDDMAVI